MLADARAQRFVESFAGQWLRLRELDDFPSQDPEWDADLRAAFRHETELLFADALRERTRCRTLLDADYTYLNERLAAHYGISGVHDSYMRRVALPPDSPRRGLLGQGSLLTITSAPNRTSPVVRGAVDRAEPARRGGAEPAARRRGRLWPRKPSRRRSSSATPCASASRCIARIPRAPCATRSWIPSGSRSRTSTSSGRWREQEDGHAVNAATQLTDGTRIAGVADLRRALLSRSDAFVAALTERLMTYALGRELDYYDRPVAREVVRDATSAWPLARGARASHRRERFVPEAREDRARRRRRPPVGADLVVPTDRRGVIFPGSQTMRYLTEQASFAAHAAARRRRALALPLLESMIPAGMRTRGRGRRAARAARLRLHSARLHHESLGADGRRPRVRAPADLEVARAVSRPPQHRERPQARRPPTSANRPRPRITAARRSVGSRARRRAAGRRRRPSTRSQRDRSARTRRCRRSSSRSSPARRSRI